MLNPRGLSCVISVGAVDENDTAAYFTLQGHVTWQDTEFGDYPYDSTGTNPGLIRPDVCAPGVMIWSLEDNSLNDYYYMSGTSQAAPCVAGVVALMLSKNSELTPAQICLILEKTALKLTPKKSNVTGAGRVDAYAAVNAVPKWDAVNESIVGDEEDVWNASIQLIDMNGRVVLTGKDAQNSLSTQNLPSGIYVLRTIHNNQVKTQKIIIH